MPLVPALTEQARVEGAVQTQGQLALHRMTVNQANKPYHHSHQQNKNSKTTKIKCCFYNTDEPNITLSEISHKKVRIIKLPITDKSREKSKTRFQFSKRPGLI